MTGIEAVNREAMKKASNCRAATEQEAVGDHPPTPLRTRRRRSRRWWRGRRSEIEGVDVTSTALTVSSSDVLEAGRYLLGTPATGLHEGALKHGLRRFYTGLDAQRGRPSAVHCQGNEGTEGPARRRTPSRRAGMGEGGICGGDGQTDPRHTWRRAGKLGATGPRLS